MRMSFASIITLLLAACGGSSATVTDTPVPGEAETAVEEVAEVAPVVEPDVMEMEFTPAEGFPHPVVHWEICSQWWDELQEFYAELFGWHVEPMPYETVDYAMVYSSGMGYGIAGGLCRTPDEGGPSYLTVYAYTEDLQATLDQAVALGATPVMQPTLLEGGAGSIAMFNDPEGRLFGLWSAEGMDMAEMTMEHHFSENAVVHFELGSHDAGATQGFYTELFGWQTQTDAEHNYTELAASGGMGIDGGIMQFEAGQEMSAYTTVYVGVPDLQMAYDRAVELGGVGLMPPTHVMEGIDVAMLSDVAGNVFGLFLIRPEGMPQPGEVPGEM